MLVTAYFINIMYTYGIIFLCLLLLQLLLPLLLLLYIDLLNMYHFRTTLPGRIIDVRYEEVVHNPKKIMQKVLKNLGDVKWEEDILDFHKSNRIVHTHSMNRKFICLLYTT